MKLKKELIRQFIYNVLGTILPTIVLQLVILPLIARKMDGDTYGFVLAVVASIMMVSAGVGNVLNNIRMLSDIDYKEKNVIGDFGILFIVGIISVGLITSGILWHYNVKSFREYLLIFIMSSVVFTKEYYIVRFWIDLDYLRILLCNLICVLGYMVGYVIYCTGGNWQYIYIMGNLLSIFYIVHKYGIPKYSFSRTALFLPTTKKFGALVIATILGRALQYVDRLLLYPMLGGEDVTIYYVATLIGKTISMALGPLNSFLLSQLSKRTTLKKKIFIKILMFTLIAGAASYVICILLAKPFLGLLYPQWIELSMKYVHVTTITAIISATTMVISPIVLRFCNINWQILINGVCFVAYIGASLILLNGFGLMGFCFGGLLANSVSLCLMIIIYVCTYKEKEN